MRACISTSPPKGGLRTGETGPRLCTQTSTSHTASTYPFLHFSLGRDLQRHSHSGNGRKYAHDGTRSRAAAGRKAKALQGLGKSMAECKGAGGITRQASVAVFLCHSLCTPTFFHGTHVRFTRLFVFPFSSPTRYLPCLSGLYFPFSSRCESRYARFPCKPRRHV